MAADRPPDFAVETELEGRPEVGRKPATAGVLSRSARPALWRESEFKFEVELQIQRSAGRAGLDAARVCERCAGNGSSAAAGCWACREAAYGSAAGCEHASVRQYAIVQLRLHPGEPQRQRSELGRQAAG